MHVSALLQWKPRSECDGRFVVEQLDASIPKAHNGYIELLLGVGISGLILYMIVLVGSGFRFLRAHVASSHTLSAFGLSMFLANSALAQTEDIYISASGSGTAGSVSFADEDIVRCDRSGGPGSCIWDLFLDGSAEGIGRAADLTAFHVQDEDNILLAFKTPKRIGNLKKVDDSDIVHFDRTASPGSAFSFFFDGSDVGLETDDESIDAMGFNPADGRLVISTDGDVGNHAASSFQEVCLL